jgi:nucleotide-binding universal stress UspA family protein
MSDPETVAGTDSADALVGAVPQPAILLATEGRPISPLAVAKAAELAIAHHATVHVLAVARIWGSAFGLPHPGLQPTARELDAQRGIVGDAITALRQRHVEATGEVTRSRGAAALISKRAQQRSCLAIVMTADPKPHWLKRALMWSYEPYRVGRLTKLPFHLIIDAESVAPPVNARSKPLAL